MSLFGVAARVPRLGPFWTAVTDRLRTAEMDVILGGQGRVYLHQRDRIPETEDETSELAYWGRLVVAPVSTIWQQDDRPGRDQLVRWLVRVDVHGQIEAGWMPEHPLEAAHEEAFGRIHGWVPGALQNSVDDTVAVGRLPAYRMTQPQPSPFWDEARGVWFTSAEYRCLIESPDAAI